MRRALALGIVLSGHPSRTRATAASRASCVSTHTRSSCLASPKIHAFD
jgi:hypothetical protein